jgi:hypothetical protein
MDPQIAQHLDLTGQAPASGQLFWRKDRSLSFCGRGHEAIENPHPAVAASAPPATDGDDAHPRLAGGLEESCALGAGVTPANGLEIHLMFHHGNPFQSVL